MNMQQLKNQQYKLEWDQNTNQYKRILQKSTIQFSQPDSNLQREGINIIYDPKQEDDVDFVIFSNLNNPVVRYRTKWVDEVSPSYEKMSKIVDYGNPIKPSNYHKL